MKPHRFHRAAEVEYVEAAKYYAVIFLEHPDGIWIVGVMHLKREPGVWRERL